MRATERSYVTFSLPDGIEAPAGLEGLGATLGVERERSVAVFDVDLGTRSIETLRTQVLELVEPGDGFVSMRVWPTQDHSRPLHEQLGDLRQSSRKPVSIGYYVVASGWGLCVLAAPGQATTVSCSYLEDALGDLVDLARAALDSGEGRCSFVEEPGEYRWIFGSLGLRVLWFPEQYGTRPDREGESLFEVACTCLELARAILRCASDVEQRYGRANYMSLWREHPFPGERLDKLRLRLQETKRRGEA
ncbi:MAG: hypothetical protein AAF721_06325 [Myxococcota bacterium]